MAAAEITLATQCDLSGAIFIFLLPVLSQVIFVIMEAHIIVVIIYEEVLMQVTVNFLFNLARLNFEEQLRKFVHLSHHEVRVELLKLLTGELKV